MATIESLRSGDEAAAHALGRQAFNATIEYDPDAPSFGDGRHVAAYDGGRLVGQVRRAPFGQYFGGRCIPCAGVTSVAVAAEARGRGLGRPMLIETLERAAADGEVIAALFPTTASLYRSVGFEVAGRWTQWDVPIGELPRGGTDPQDAVEWELVEVGDPRTVAVYDSMAADHDGWLRFTSVWWDRAARRARADSGTNRYLYLGVRSGEPVAAVGYTYAATTASQALYRIEVDSLHGVDGPAVRAGLALLAGNGTTTDVIRTATPVDVLEQHVVQQQRLAVVGSWPWMVAFVDLPAAIAARGYPAAVAGTVTLSVRDTTVPANAGTWAFTVGDGTAHLERCERSTSSVVDADLDVRDLASMFTGHLDPLRVARAGRLGHPDARTIGLLRAAFAGQPSLTTWF